MITDKNSFEWHEDSYKIETYNCHKKENHGKVSQNKDGWFYEVYSHSYFEGEDMLETSGYEKSKEEAFVAASDYILRKTEGFIELNRLQMVEE